MLPPMQSLQLLLLLLPLPPSRSRIRGMLGWHGFQACIKEVQGEEFKRGACSEKENARQSCETICILELSACLDELTAPYASLCARESVCLSVCLSFRFCMHGYICLCLFLPPSP